ncbi:MAG: hypothetical protein IJ914_00155 [Prevotella sp.]|nr:hypothetical protein [Prevotella sp.]
MKSLKLRDLCLLLGCPCVVFLSISLLVSLKVGADFRQDSLAKWMAFILCNLLLWLLYVMFQSVLLDLFPQKRDRQSIAIPQTMKQVVQTDVVPEMENTNPLPLMANDSTSLITPNSETLEESVSVKTKEDSYIQRCKAYEQEQEQRRKETIAAILDYARYTMSPYVYDSEELENLCEEVRHWSEEYTYSPIPIRLKQRLTTLDLRHFVWNIGERLGTKNGYNGYARADFIKAMFPDVMKDIEQDSIRNFKFQPNKGSIVIDEPDEDNYHFHIK